MPCPPQSSVVSRFIFCLLLVTTSGFPAKTTGVEINVTVSRLKLLYFIFSFRVMQGVAWLMSVLVIGINMFFVAEYVVSYETSLHIRPPHPPPLIHTEYRL